MESFVKSVEEFADSLYTVIADRAGEMNIQFLLCTSCLVKQLSFCDLFPLPISSVVQFSLLYDDVYCVCIPTASTATTAGVVCNGFCTCICIQVMACLTHLD